MNARATLGITAAGVLTFGAVLLGQGNTFGQEPAASPPAAASPAADTVNGSMTMDPADVGAMMGEAVGHMMGAMMSMDGSRGTMGDDQRGARDWDHASHGMMGGPSGGDSHEACLNLMQEMATMMESMLSGSSGMGMGSGMDGGMSMGGSSPASAASSLPSPTPDPVDHAAHHAAPSSSPAA